MLKKFFIIAVDDKTAIQFFVHFNNVDFLMLKIVIKSLKFNLMCATL